MSDKRDLLEEDLFGDLELPTAAEPATPNLNVGSFESSPGVRTENKTTHTRTTAQALKHPPKRSLTGLWIALAIVFVVGGGGVGALFFMQVGPFAPVSVSSQTKSSMRIQKNVRKKVEIQLKTQPNGAGIRVNGKKLPFKTPYTLRVVHGRSYTIELHKKGFVVSRRVLDTSKSKKSRFLIDLKLQGGAPAPPMIKGNPGVLFLDCSPIGAKIYIGTFLHEKRCSAKAVRIELQGGKKLQLKLEKEGFTTHEEPITVTAADVKMLKVSLKKASSPSKRRTRKKVSVRTVSKQAKRVRVRRVRKRKVYGSGKATIVCSPAADVYWKGNKIGRTPLTHSFPAGRHRIVLKNNRLNALRGVSMSVQSKKTTTHRFKLRKGKLKFIVRPWADVFVNGRKIGQTPIRPYSVYEGFYSIKLKMNKRTKMMRIRVRGEKTAPVIHIFN